VQRKKNAQANQVNESRSKMNFLDSVKSGVVQPKLSIGKATDKFEVEADQMADKVMRMPEVGVKGNIAHAAMPAIQRKCDGCEAEETTTEELQVPSIQAKEMDVLSANDENIQPKHKDSLRHIVDVQNPTIQMKASAHSMRIFRKEEEETILQRQGNENSGRGPPMGDFSSKLNQAKGSGQPMDSATNSFMSSRFGADFSNVKIHTGSQASNMSNSINAKAFTHQNHVYFNQGQYQPNSHAGKSLLAHELTHTIQQGATGGNVQRKCSTYAEGKVQAKLNIGALNDKLEQEADDMADHVMRKCSSCEEDSIQAKIIDQTSSNRQQSFGDKVLTKHTSLEGGVQRTPLTCSEEDYESENEFQVCEAVLDQQVVIDTMSAHGLSLDDDDVIAISQKFPAGFRLISTELVVGDFNNTHLEGLKIRGYRVVDNSQQSSSLKLIVFNLGKGRSLMVSNTNNTGSIVFDAGAGATSNSNGKAAVKLRQAYSDVFRSGMAENPIFLTISHFDSDHINSIKQIFQLPNFGETAIRVSRQMIDSTVGQGDWNRMTIELNPSQSIVRIEVASATGVSVNSSVIGNIQLTEYRLVAAHQELMSSDRKTYNKNATSEMAIVRDRISGRTMAFTGDIEGRTLYSIIDIVGRDAFRRTLSGGDGRNLEIAEIPHHGGRVAPAHVHGMLLYYQLAFEASKGDLTFMTQTSPNFANGNSASINVMETINMPVQRFMSDPSLGGRSQVARYAGAMGESITINNGSIEATHQLVRNNRGALSEAYSHRHNILTLQENINELSEVFVGARGVFPELAASVETFREQLTRYNTELNVELENVWGAMRTAGASEGLRRTTDLENVRTATDNLRSRVGEMRVEGVRGGLEMHLKGIQAYNEFFINLGRMVEALEAGDSSKIRELKAEQVRLFANARGVLGDATVENHVRGAWRRVRSVWTPRLIRSVSRKLSMEAVERRMNSDFRSELFGSLKGHMELVRELHRMGSGHVTPMRPISTGRRVGAGLMAGIEVLRIGLEFGIIYKEAAEAEERSNAINKRNGLLELSWWQGFKVIPALGIVERGMWSGGLSLIDGYDTQKVLETVKDTSSTVDYEKLVITGVSDNDLKMVVDSLIIQVSTRQDWIEVIEGAKGGAWFKKFESGWGVRLWKDSAGEYQYFIKSFLNEPLDFLYEATGMNQEWLLEEEVDESSNPLYSVADTAIIFGNDRYVTVYNSLGRLRGINFENENPKFTKIHKEQVPFRSGGVVRSVNMWVVKAANMETYNALSRHYWTQKIGTYLDGRGKSHDQIKVFRNSTALGYVREDDLIVTVGSLVEFQLREWEKENLQPKLKVGAPNDKFEQEADQMADQVMRSPMKNEAHSSISRKTVQRSCAACKEEQVQRKSWDKEEEYNPYLTQSVTEAVQRKCASCEDDTAQRSAAQSDGGFTASSSFQTGLNASKGSGQTMGSGTQSFMENRFGADFSNVNIHTGSKASKLNNQINAKAFTTGNDIYFNQGEYAPNSSVGKHLLAHELTHTVQQGASKHVRRTPYEEGEREASQSSPGKVEFSSSPFGMRLYAYAINEDWMKPEHLEGLNELASLLLANPELSAQINGHSDSIGAESYNEDLSEHRAKFVGGYLRTLGIENVYEIWTGEMDPITSDDSASDRELNRGVDVLIYGMDEMQFNFDDKAETEVEKPEITPEMREAFCAAHPWICAGIGTGVALAALIIAFCASNPEICVLPIIPLVGGPPGVPPGGGVPEPESPELEREDEERERTGENPVKASTAHAYLPIRNRLNSTYYSETDISLPNGYSDTAGISMSTPYLTNATGKIGEGSSNITSKQKNIYGHDKLPTKGVLEKGYNGHMVFIKGHLLNHRVGGPAAENNLFPITQQANKDHELGPEKWVTDNVLGQGTVQDGGNLVYYRVDVANRTEPNLIDVFGDGSCVFYYIDSDLVCSYSTYRLLESGRIEQNTIIRNPIYSRMQHVEFASLVREKVANGDITCGTRGESRIQDEEEVQGQELSERLRSIQPQLNGYCPKAMANALIADVTDYTYHPMTVGYPEETRTETEEVFKTKFDAGWYDRNAREIFDSYYRREMTDGELIDVLEELARVICAALDIIQSKSSPGMSLTHPNYVVLDSDIRQKMNDPSSMLYYFRQVYGLEAPVQSTPLIEVDSVQPKLKDNNIIQREPKNLPREDLQVKGVQDVVAQTSNKVYFEKNSSALDFLQEIKIATLMMGATPPKEIYLYGYASEEGPKSANNKLIAQRLSAVKKAIESYTEEKVKVHVIARPKESQNSYKYREFRAVQYSLTPVASTNGVSNTTDRDCTITEHADIDKTRNDSITDVSNAYAKVVNYFRAPAKHPDVEATLDLYFGDHSDNVIAHVLRALKLIKSDLPKIKGNTVRRCADGEHAFCSRAYALTSSQVDILFCPKYFNATEASFKRRILIHEMGHFIKLDLEDIAYAHSRVFRYTSPKNALINSDSYTMFVNDVNGHVIKSKKNTLKDPVGDIVNGCGKNQAVIEEALSRAERWNSLGASGMKQTYASVSRLAQMKPYLEKEFGKVNKFSLAGIYDRANKLKSIYRGQKFTMNCLPKTNVGCGKTAIANLNTKGEIDVCPAFFSLPENDQIIKIGAEVTKFVPEIQDKYRESYVRIGYDYKKKFWQQ
jgi:outer membrane protein OmpA-like peptidoglycan-associated protein